MCLAVPGKIESIEKELDDVFRSGKVSFGGLIKEVNLSMVTDAQVGDYVLVHVGVALSIIDEEEARKTLGYLQQLGELSDLNP
ncbi:MAG: HypC/HybG/HupF family hydrogenase formation chaperone [Bacteroidetes bacterium]|nr:MAG: HypC/HybG/HupF family hydrogenase formation chaperone [Bacteroidota bacterium]